MRRQVGDSDPVSTVGLLAECLQPASGQKKRLAQEVVDARRRWHELLGVRLVDTSQC